MAGYDCVERAIAHGDDPSNNGNGYALRVTLNSGVQFEGPVGDLISETETLKLQILSLDIFINCAEVAAAEVVW
jgi:hypothetical protein